MVIFRAKEGRKGQAKREIRSEQREVREGQVRERQGREGQGMEGQGRAGKARGRIGGMGSTAAVFGTSPLRCLEGS